MVSIPIVSLFTSIRCYTSAASASILDPTGSLLDCYHHGGVTKENGLRVLATRLGYDLRPAVRDRWTGYVEDLEASVGGLPFGRAIV